jgi:hypothetical protein
MTTKEQTIEFLRRKIADLDEKITNLEKFNVSEKKIEGLKFLKLQYENDLEELLNS